MRRPRPHSSDLMKCALQQGIILQEIVTELERRVSDLEECRCRPSKGYPWDQIFRFTPEAQRTLREKVLRVSRVKAG